MKCERHESIEKTRICFEESFEAGSLYNRQTQDQEHLELILDSLKINTGMKILDLGTGTGYLAFPIAEKYPDAEVIGLDIVENALNVIYYCKGEDVTPRLEKAIKEAATVKTRKRESGTCGCL